MTAPKTEEQQVARNLAGQAAMTSAGQRQINLIWEKTQVILSVSVVWASLVVALILALGSQAANQQVAIVALFGMANLVIGFYFGRTNHQRTGGVGPVALGGVDGEIGR